MVDSSEENTGYTVAKFLKEKLDNGKFESFPDIIIHSYNPIGADNIQNLFPFSQKLPFGTYNILPTLNDLDGNLQSIEVKVINDNSFITEVFELMSENKDAEENEE
jgi:hypothetical protein